MKLGNSIECSKWKTMIQDAWTKATTAVQRIKDKDGNSYTPDGNGTVELNYSPAKIDGIEVDVKDNASAIATETTNRVSADNALQTQISSNASSIATIGTDVTNLKATVANNTSDIATNKSDIATNTTDISNLKTSDTTLQSNIDKKQDKLTAGDGTVIIDNTIYANNNVQSLEKSTYNPSNRNLSLGYTYREIISAFGDGTPTRVTASKKLFALGTGLKESTDSTSAIETPTIDVDTSVVQTKLTAGNGINIADDGTISTQSSAPTAEQVNLTDGRSVQTVIDAIEDEIGDESTAGSIKYVEKTNTDNIATNTSNITALQTSVSNLETSVASKQDTLTAGTGILIDDSGNISSTTLIANFAGGYGGSASESQQKKMLASVTRRLNVSGEVRTVQSTPTLFNLGTGLIFNDPETYTAGPTIDVDTSVIQPLLTAGTGIGITDATISNSGVRSASATGITASGTGVPTSVLTGNRYSGITVDTNGTNTTIPLLYGYHQTTQATAGTNSVPATYSSSANINGGLKIQWGEFYAHINGTSYHKAVVNMRYSYSNANTYVVIPVIHDYNANDLWSYQVIIEDKTTTTFEVHVSNGNSGTDISKDCKIMWLAIGF